MIEANDFLICLEAEEGNWGWVQDWLNEKKERRLVFIDSPLLLEHPQIRYYSIDSPLQIEPLAKQIAWEAVLLEMEIRGGKSEMCRLLRQRLEKAHRAANLLLSDAADFGCTMTKHCFARGNRPVRRGLNLANAFVDVPALIVGAGPSLEKNGHLLSLFQDRALILAGGSALKAIDIEPHFAAAIDQEASYRDSRRPLLREGPFCFQSRMNPDNFSFLRGEAILFPDSHFEFLNEGKPLNGGWTVGTFLIALATLMGCDPIVLVGMDFCYHSGCKYTGGKKGGQVHLVEAVTRDGVKVQTQPDWLMARDWIEEWAAQYFPLRFLNATEGGLGFASPVQTVRLSELQFEARGNLRQQVDNIVHALPFATMMQWELWRKSLENCKRALESALWSGEESFKEESVYERLLLPLWHMWRPIFSRAFACDPHPDALKINQLLFFQQVIQNHLQILEVE